MKSWTSFGGWEQKSAKKGRKKAGCPYVLNNQFYDSPQFTRYKRTKEARIRTLLASRYDPTDPQCLFKDPRLNQGYPLSHVQRRLFIRDPNIDDIRNVIKNRVNNIRDEDLPYFMPAINPASPPSNVPNVFSQHIHQMYSRRRENNQQYHRRNGVLSNNANINRSATEGHNQRNSENSNNLPNSSEQNRINRNFGEPILNVDVSSTSSSETNNDSAHPIFLNDVDDDDNNNDNNNDPDESNDFAVDDNFVNLGASESHDIDNIPVNNDNVTRGAT